MTVFAQYIHGRFEILKMVKLLWEASLDNMKLPVACIYIIRLVVKWNYVIINIILLKQLGTHEKTHLMILGRA